MWRKYNGGDGILYWKKTKTQSQKLVFATMMKEDILFHLKNEITLFLPPIYIIYVKLVFCYLLPACYVCV